MSEPNTRDGSAMVTRGRGRPRAEQRLEQVGTRLPAVYYDRLIQIANEREISVSRLVRQLLIVRLR